MKIKNLTFMYENSNLKVLDNISVDFESGKCYHLTGANGSGKSTFINCIMGLIKCKSSEITTPPNFKIGFIPQEIALLENLTVKDNIKFFSLISKVKNNENNLIKQFNLNFYNKKIKNISGGQKRLVNFICGVLSEHTMLILDEPFEGIDSEMKNMLNSYLHTLKQSGVTILIITHHKNEVNDLADFELNLSKGKLTNKVYRKQNFSYYVKFKELNSEIKSFCSDNKLEITEDNKVHFFDDYLISKILSFDGAEYVYKN